MILKNFELWMNTCPYHLMQQTVDAVLNSPHETSKVAATLVLPAQKEK
jgi:hypothetical protein